MTENSFERDGFLSEICYWKKDEVIEFSFFININTIEIKILRF